MKPLTIDRRVEIVEQKVEKLEILPDRLTALEVQISEFRAEVRAEFSDTRTGLRQEMRALNDETRAEMRMLHEDVIKRISLINERPGPKKPSGRAR